MSLILTASIRKPSRAIRPMKTSAPASRDAVSALTGLSNTLWMADTSTPASIRSPVRSWKKAVKPWSLSIKAPARSEPGPACHTSHVKTPRASLARIDQ